MRDAQGRALLVAARSMIHECLGGPEMELPREAFDAERAGSFVTVRKDGSVHGCVGSITPRASLLEEVCNHAIAAAFHDPRSAPLRASELPRARLELSVLTPPQPLAFRDEAGALSQVRPGIDGLVLQAGPLRSVLLPQVWEDLPEPAEFLAHLKLKAGLPAEYWSAEVALQRFEVSKWQEAP